MSMESLVDAVAARIRSACSYSESECGVQPDGGPPASAGQRYWAISPGEWTNNDSGAEVLDEMFGVVATLSLRVSVWPRDRHGQEAVRKAASGMYALAEAVRAAVMMNYDVLNNANEAVGDDYNGFVEPLKFRGGGPPRREGPRWWGSDDPGDGEEGGLVLELTFFGARRLQRLDGMG